MLNNLFIALVVLFALPLAVFAASAIGTFLYTAYASLLEEKKK